MRRQRVVRSSRRLSAASRGASIKAARVLRRALLVDGDIEFAELARNELEHAGWFVVHAEEGVEALDLMTSSSFDLVLLELEVDGINGWELLRYLRGQWELGLPLMREVTRVIATSRRREVEVARFIRRLGADEFLRKPVDTVTLPHVADRLVPRHIVAKRSRGGIEVRA